MHRPNHLTARAVVMASAAGIVLAGATLPCAAKSKCEHPQGIAEQRACAEAGHGLEALRAFVLRTRAIYGLYLLDFVPAEESTTQAPAATTPLSLAAAR